MIETLAVVALIGWGAQFYHDVTEEPQIKEVVKYVTIENKKFKTVVPKYKELNKMVVFKGRSVLMVSKKNVDKLVEDRTISKQCIQYVNKKLPEEIKKFNEE